MGAIEARRLVGVLGGVKVTGGSVYNQTKPDIQDNICGCHRGTTIGGLCECH